VIRQDPALLRRAQAAGIDRSVEDRVQQQSRNRERGIER